MILANHGIISSSGGSVDTDALAFITAASITDNTQKTAINTLVTDLKSYNIWTKMKALYPFVGGSATSHKWNLKDPRDLDVAFRLTFSGGWTHSNNGVLPNGINAYANTFFIPKTSLSQYNVHMSSYIRAGLSNGYKVSIGANYDSSTNTGAYTGIDVMYQGSTTGIYYGTANSETNATNYVKSANASAVGFWNTTRLTSGLDLRLFKNGTKVDTITTSPSVQYQPDHPMYISALPTKYLSVFTIGGYSDHEQAFASIGDGLSDTEAANFYTAVQNYNTTLLRNI